MRLAFAHRPVVSHPLLLPTATVQSHPPHVVAYLPARPAAMRLQAPSQVAFWCSALDGYCDAHPTISSSVVAPAPRLVVEPPPHDEIAVAVRGQNPGSRCSETQDSTWPRSSTLAARTEPGGSRHCGDTTSLVKNNMVRCGVCHYVSPPNVKGHTARTCPINQVECRRSLPVGHPFKEVGQCLLGNCIHHETCTTCGLTGHLVGTQKLSDARYKLNEEGSLVRKQSKKALNTSDFVCMKITAVAVKTLIANANNASTAADAAKIKRLATVSRLRGNVHAGRIDVEETIELMEEMGSDAAILQAENKPVFQTLVKNAHLGAVEAGKKAAEAAESDVEDDGLVEGASDLVSSGEEDSAVEGNTRWAVKSGKNKNKKKQGVFLGAPSRRMSNYAASVVKGRRAKHATPPRKLFKSVEPKTCKNGKAKSSASSGSSAVAALDPVDGIVFGLGVDVAERWPSGTRAAFSDALPMFTFPAFGAYTSVQVAHLVLEKVTQRPVAEIDVELSGYVTKAAVDRHVRGYMLASGTLSAAHVAEWLCCLMSAPLQTAMLTSVAQAIRTIVGHFKKLSESPVAPPKAVQVL